MSPCIRKLYLTAGYLYRWTLGECGTSTISRLVCAQIRLSERREHDSIILYVLGKTERYEHYPRGNQYINSLAISGLIDHRAVFFMKEYIRPVYPADTIVLFPPPLVSPFTEKPLSRGHRDTRKEYIGCDTRSVLRKLRKLTCISITYALLISTPLSTYVS